MSRGDIDNGFRMGGLDLVVPGEAAEVTQPGKGALDHPALGQQDKAFGFLRSLDHFHLQVAMARQLGHPLGELAGRAAIDKDRLEPALEQQERLQEFGPLAILHTGRMDDHPQSRAERDRLPQAARRVSAANQSNPRYPPGGGAFVPGSSCLHQSHALRAG